MVGGMAARYVVTNLSSTLRVYDGGEGPGVQVRALQPRDRAGQTHASQALEASSRVLVVDARPDIFPGKKFRRVHLCDQDFDSNFASLNGRIAKRLNGHIVVCNLHSLTLGGDGPSRCRLSLRTSDQVLSVVENCAYAKRMSRLHRFVSLSSKVAVLDWDFRNTSLKFLSLKISAVMRGKAVSYSGVRSTLLRMPREQAALSIHYPQAEMTAEAPNENPLGVGILPGSPRAAASEDSSASDARRQPVRKPYAVSKVRRRHGAPGGVRGPSLSGRGWSNHLIPARPVGSLPSDISFEQIVREVVEVCVSATHSSELNAAQIERPHFRAGVFKRFGKGKSFIGAVRIPRFCLEYPGLSSVSESVPMLAAVVDLRSSTLYRGCDSSALGPTGRLETCMTISLIVRSSDRIEDPETPRRRTPDLAEVKIACSCERATAVHTVRTGTSSNCKKCRPLLDALKGSSRFRSRLLQNFATSTSGTPMGGPRAEVHALMNVPVARKPTIAHKFVGQSLFVVFLSSLRLAISVSMSPRQSPHARVLEQHEHNAGSAIYSGLRILCNWCRSKPGLSCDHVRCVQAVLKEDSNIQMEDPVAEEGIAPGFEPDESSQTGTDALGNDSSPEPLTFETLQLVAPNQYASRKRRPFFPCPSDERAARKILTIIRDHIQVSDVSNLLLRLSDQVLSCREASCRFWKHSSSHVLKSGSLKPPSVRLSTRKMWLQTTLGPVRAIVHDWECPECGTDNFYEGADDSIYVASRHCGISTQVLSEWLHAVIIGGIPFRRAYGIWLNRLYQQQRLRDVPVFSHSRDNIGNTSTEASWPSLAIIPREQASSAFFGYLHVLDTPVGSSLQNLFRCTTCEYVDENGNRRMRAVAIDGTAIGHLSPFSNSEAQLEEDPIVLPPLTKRDAKYLYLVEDSHLREGLRRVMARLGKEVSSVLSENLAAGIRSNGSSEDDSFSELEQREIVVSVHDAVGSELGGRKTRADTRLKRANAILLMFNNTRSGNRLEEDPDLVRELSQANRQSVRRTVQRPVTGRRNGASDEARSEADSIQLRLRLELRKLLLLILREDRGDGQRRISARHDSSSELLDLVDTESASSGGQGSSRSREIRELDSECSASDTSESGRDSPGERASDVMLIVHFGNRVHSGGTTVSSTTVAASQWSKTRLDLITKIADFIDVFFGDTVVPVLQREYVRNACLRYAEALRCVGTSTTPLLKCGQEVEPYVASLASLAVSFHSVCVQDSPEESESVLEADRRLYDTLQSVSAAEPTRQINIDNITNTVDYEFIIANDRPSGPVTSRIVRLGDLVALGNCLAGILEGAVKHMEVYDRILKNYRTRQSSNRSSEIEFGPCNDREAQEGPRSEHETSRSVVEANITGELYPGRPQCRPGIKFSKTKSDTRGRRHRSQSAACNKAFSRSASHSPGLLVTVCCCRRPRILGATVMRNVESPSQIASTIIRRFSTLPDEVIYDTSCVVSTALASRIPEIFDHTRFVLDRFHGTKGHTCPSQYHLNSYPHLADLLSSNQESVNSLLVHHKASIRYMNSRNVTPFLLVRAVCANLMAHYRHVSGRDDAEGADLANLLFSVCRCACLRCSACQVTGPEEADTGSGDSEYPGSSSGLESRVRGRATEFSDREPIEPPCQVDVPVPQTQAANGSERPENRGQLGDRRGGEVESSTGLPHRMPSDPVDHPEHDAVRAANKQDEHHGGVAYSKDPVAESANSRKGIRNIRTNELIELTALDKSRLLAPATWWTDGILNAYMTMISNRSATNFPASEVGSFAESAPLGMPSVLSFNSFFFIQIQTQQRAALSRAARGSVEDHPSKEDTASRTLAGLERKGGRPLLSYDIFLIPIHSGRNHWSLISCDVKERTLVHYDSMFSPERSEYILTTLHQFFCEHVVAPSTASGSGSPEVQQGPVAAGGTPKMLEWRTRAEGVQVPQQPNGYDCGVFVCIFAEKLTRREAVTFDTKSGPQMRASVQNHFSQGYIS